MIHPEVQFLSIYAAVKLANKTDPTRTPVTDIPTKKGEKMKGIKGVTGLKQFLNPTGQTPLGCKPWLSALLWTRDSAH